MLFLKESRFGNNVFRIQCPTMHARCVVVDFDGKHLWLRDFPSETVEQIVRLETRVCQDLYPNHTLAWPWHPHHGLRTKIPTRYSHIIIPMTDAENRRIVSSQLTAGAALDIELQPTSAWEQAPQCGIAWTVKRIRLLC